MAKSGIHGIVASITAAADLTAKLFIGYDGDVCGAGAKALGASILPAATGEQASVVTSGIAVVMSGGSFAVGAPVKSSAAGKAVAATDVTVTVPTDTTPVTSDAAQPDLVVAGGVLPEAINGYALDEATGSDQEIRIKLV